MNIFKNNKVYKKQQIRYTKINKNRKDKKEL